MGERARERVRESVIERVCVCERERERSVVELELKHLLSLFPQRSIESRPKTSPLN